MSDVVPPGQMPAKKKGRGCLIALGIFGALFVLVMLVIGIAVWRFSKSEQGRAIGDALTATMSGASAPGTKELAEAFGCQAMVLDGAAFERVAKAFGEKPKGELPAKIVACAIHGDGPAPTCAQVAEVYRNAVGAAAGEFGVSVNREGRKELCNAMFRP